MSQSRLSIDMMQRSMRSLNALLILFLVVIAYSLFLSFQLSLGLPNGVAKHIGTQVVAQYLVAYVLMFWVWYSMPAAPEAKLVRSLLFCGVVARLVLIVVEPYTSNDVSRYLFDGRILLEGLDPYRLAHDAPELVDLRAQWLPPSEHAKYVTLYPPLALVLYSAASSFGTVYAVLAWKVLTALASLALLAVGYKVLKQAKLLRHLPLISLSPLLIFEAGEAAHIDVFSALSVIAAIWAWQYKRWLLTGAIIGIGACVKILPLFLILPLALYVKTWRARGLIAIGCFVTLFLVYGAALVSGLRPVGSISVFFAKWRASSPLFYWLEPYLGQHTMLLLVLAIGLLGVSFLFVLGWLSRNKPSGYAFSLAQALFALPLMLSPVIFPWYLMPLAVIFALRPNLIVAVWMVALPISYEVLNQFLCCGVWAPAGWVTNLIGWVVITALIVTFVQRSLVIRKKNQVAV